MSSSEHSSLVVEETINAKRAYNRESAARARKRRKVILAALQMKIEDLTLDKMVLRHSLSVMKEQLDELTKRNEDLMLQDVQRFTTSAMKEESSIRNRVDMFRMTDRVFPQKGIPQLRQQMLPMASRKVPGHPICDQGEWYPLQPHEY